MKLEVGATPPVGRHRRLANGSSSAGIAPVALTQPTPNSEEPIKAVARPFRGLATSPWCVLVLSRDDRLKACYLD